MSGKLSRLKSKQTRKIGHGSWLNANGSMHHDIDTNTAMITKNTKLSCSLLQALYIFNLYMMIIIINLQFILLFVVFAHIWFHLFY